MKTWKFAVSFLAASLMANSQLAWAAADLNQKKEYNKFLKERILNDGATMSSFYENNKSYYDSPSKAWIEAWLQNFGGEALPTVDTQIIKDKNANETIKLIIGKSGATATLTMNTADEDHFTVNGQKFYYLEATNLATIFNRLATTDSNYKAMALEMNSEKPPARQKGGTDYLSIQQFMALKPIQKVEYLQHWRGVIEAAQRVNEVRYGAQNEESSAKSYAHLHPALQAMVAWAAPADGVACVVAGNVSTYKGGSCKADPSSRFNKMCVASGSGDVACNPLVYGLASPDKPFCLKSTDQPGFTQRATIMCNEKSPINGAQDSKERNLSYQRILTTYLMGKGGDPINFGKCFNQASEVDPKCKDIFEPQLQEFEALQQAADLACQVKTLPDQPDACASLKQRTLDLNFFTQGLVTAPIVVTAGNSAKAECEKDPKNKWNKEKKTCERPIVVKNDKLDTPKKEDKCKNSKSLKCNPLAILGIVAGVAVLAWLLLGKKKKPPKVRPPTTTLPRSEGGSGTGSGTNGGVRGTDGAQ